MSKFGDCIQPGDKVIFNEDLGCRVNLSLLDRVAKKEKPVSKDLENASISYADENCEERMGEIESTYPESGRNAFINPIL